MERKFEDSRDDAVEHNKFFCCGLFVFGVAFLWRLRFLFGWQSTPYALQPLLDAAFYHNWASKIATGQLLNETAFYQSPLYAYFLGILYNIFEPSVLFASIVQLFLSSFTCLLVAATARRSFGSTVGWYAGIIAAFYGPFVFYSAPLLKETLSLFLLAFFMHEAQRNLCLEKTRSVVGAGFLLGLSILTRGNFLIFVPAFLFGLWLKQKKSAWRSSVAFLIGLAIAILPATLHNAWVSKDFVLVTYNDGFNFYIGNNTSSNAATSGINTYPPNISTDPLGGEEKDTNRYVAHFIGHAPKPSETSAFWYAEALQNIVANPSSFALRLFLKARLFINDHEIPDNYDQAFYENTYDLLQKFGSFRFSFIFTLAVFSAYLLIRQGRKDAFFYSGAFACYAFSAVLFYVTDRYRLPAVLFLIPLAAAAPMLALNALNKKEIIHLFIAFLFSLFAFSGSYLDTIVARKPSADAHNWALISWMYYIKGDYSNTLSSLERALAISEISTGGPAYISGADAASRLKQDERAEYLLTKATILYPDWDPAFFALYNWFVKIGDRKKALPFLQRAHEIDPENATYSREITLRLMQKELKP